MHFHLKFKPRDLVLVLVLIALLGIVTQNLGLGTNGLFFSIIGAIGVVKFGPQLFIALRARRKRQIVRRPHPAEFLMRPPSENFQPPFDPVPRPRQVMAPRGKVVAALLAEPGSRGKKQPGATGQDVVEHIKARKIMVLSEETAVDREVFCASGLILHPASDLKVPCVLAEEVATHGPFLLVTTHPTHYTSLVTAVPHGYIGGSAQWGTVLPRPYLPRFRPVSTPEQAVQMGRMIIQDGLQFVFNPLSYLSHPPAIEQTASQAERDQAISVQAMRMLFSLIKGMADYQATIPAEEQEPCFVFITDADDLIPDDEANSLFTVPAVATKVKKQVLSVLKNGGGYGLQVYVATSQLDALAPEAMDESSLWIITAVPTRNDASWIWSKTHMGAAALAQIAKSGTMIINRKETTLNYVRFRDAHSLAWASSDEASEELWSHPSRGLVNLDEDEEIDTEPHEKLPEVPSHRKKKDSPEWLQPWLAFACYLYAINRLTPSALKEPARDMLPLVEALGLKPYANGKQYMRYEDALDLVKRVKLKMAPAERAHYAGIARGHLAALEEATSTSSTDPPGDQTRRQEHGGQPGASSTVVSPGPTFWRLPSLDLLRTPDPTPSISTDELEVLAGKVRDVLASHNVSAEVSISDINVSPRIIRIGIRPTRNTAGKLTKVEQIKRLKDDLKLALKAKTLRMESPVSEQDYVGIEVPNPRPVVITLRELLENPSFKQAARQSKLAVALGKDMTNAVRVTHVQRMPHGLIAGMTGSGKSILIHTIIGCILMQATPDDVRLLMVDPKQTELTAYEDIPHLLRKIVIDPKEATDLLVWVVQEMERRNTILATARVRNLDEYREKRAALLARGDFSLTENLPYIVVIVDELAHLMMVAPAEVEENICKIAQLARAAGIHLILATQRPSVDIITGLIKANLPTRIACRVVSHHDSGVILDTKGAEELLGKGDMLYLPEDAGEPDRLQGPFLSTKEAEAIATWWREQAKGIPPTVAPPSQQPIPKSAPNAVQPPLPIPNWDAEAQQVPKGIPLSKTGELSPKDLPVYVAMFLRGEELPFKPGDIKNNDQLYEFVRAWACREEEISTQQIMLTFGLGNPRAARMAKRLEDDQVVGPDPGGGKRRKVLLHTTEAREEGETAEEQQRNDTAEEAVQ